MFKLKVKVGKGSENHLVGNVVISFKDSDGVHHIEKQEIKNIVVSKKEWDELSYNQEVKVQETLMIVANKNLKQQELLIWVI